MQSNIRFGIIGTNFISDWVIQGGLLDPRFEVTAVYSRNDETGRAFANKYNIPTIYTSIEELASSDLVDAVYVASPNAFHAEQSILMMQHGKHVLCEKALCSNQQEARRMIDTARRHNVLLMEAMKPTLTPNFKAVMDSLDRIGKVRRYFSCYCQYSSRYDKLKEGIVLNAWRPEMSNGSLPDIGIYTIYPMVVLFGRPRSVKATGVLLHTGVDAEGSVLFDYGDMDAVCIYSKVSDSNLPTEIQGEQGNLWLNRINIISQARLQMRNGQTETLTQPHCGEEYFYEVAHFIDLIEQGKIESPINTHDTSLAVMEIMDEIRRQIGVVYPADLAEIKN